MEHLQSLLKFFAACSFSCLVLICLSGCSPYYSGHQEGESVAAVLVELSSTSVEDRANGDLFVCNEFLEDCTQRARATKCIRIDSERSVFRTTVREEISCGSIIPLSPQDVLARYGKAGVSAEEEIPQRDTPCYSDRGRANCFQLYSDSVIEFYLQYSGSQVQLITGRYGNRAGWEDEHTYRVDAFDQVQSVRAVAHRLSYDHFPEWW